MDFIFHVFARLPAAYSLLLCFSSGLSIYTRKSRGSFFLPSSQDTLSPSIVVRWDPPPPPPPSPPPTPPPPASPPPGRSSSFTSSYYSTLSQTLMNARLSVAFAILLPVLLLSFSLRLAPAVSSSSLPPPTRDTRYGFSLSFSPIYLLPSSRLNTHTLPTPVSQLSAK